ncbi:hypothetical protein OGAPHI_002552 [Ogataea philodendri]|uniref:Uncharacterized protein n=1 Tax=Ogataea philodendri TaxID=1378263 RepID=A0A9P8PBH0_9ASCO|nr:uncharacterized protein OGAPHI_002552 [Ogataea philodendri]KAH3668797.1 hypothetical protein OGAPHI_002552 [Ogataea philodendri]
MLASDSTVRTPRRAQSALSNPPSDPLESTRKRQTKKDDQIRKKIENDLKKKNNVTMVSTFGSPQKKSKAGSGASGTVMSLKPSDPVIMKPSNTVYEAAQLMSVTKENCVLVVDDAGQLAGIFTAKDLAFRIVGSNLNANQTSIEHIMTPNPMCAKITTLASDALSLMVTKGFRHLPVVNDNHQIVGTLDITKCYNEAMTKLERMYESSKKLYDAMEGVTEELGGGQPLHVIKYFESLKNIINGPRLNSVLSDRTVPVCCDIKTSVHDAAILMKDNKTTAVLVKDSKNNDEVTGIFTSKDIVLRVIAAGIDPRTCSVIRVMTPKPSYALASSSIHQALRQMFEGRYLNLPVVDDENSEIVGVVDVLKLTYHTLNQIQSIQMINNGDSDAGSNEEKEGPAWNKFWTSLESDTNSLHSASLADVTQSELAQFNVSTNDIVRPSDSVSFTGAPETNSSALKPATVEVDFNEPVFFKFKSPQGRTHRVSCKPSDGIEPLRELIGSKLSRQEMRTLLSPAKDSETGESLEPAEQFAISYVDDEGDLVAITTDQDLKDCVFVVSNLNLDKINLLIHHPDQQVNVDSALNSAKLGNSSAAAPNDTLQELILPGVLFALAASVVVAFTFSRR